MPPFLAGRASIVRSLKADMRQVYDHSEGARPVIISGLRGMGKTVLLQELAEEARNRGWIVVWAEAAKNDSLARKLARATFVELRRLRAILDPSRSAFSHALAVLRSFQIKVDPTGSFSLGVDVKPASGYADSGDLSLDWATCCRLWARLLARRGLLFSLESMSFRKLHLTICPP